MRLLLGTTPMKWPLASNRGRPVIQNLGPGYVYLDTDGDVDADSGFQIAPGGTYEFPTASALSPQGIWFVSDTEDTDVRLVVMG